MKIVLDKFAGRRLASTTTINKHIMEAKVNDKKPAGYIERPGIKLISTGDESNNMLLVCRDCSFQTVDAAEFSDHVHECPVRPVPPTLAEIAKRQREAVAAGE